jgi:hypothetical protein
MFAEHSGIHQHVSVVLLSLIAFVAGLSGYAAGGWSLAVAGLILATFSGAIGAYWGAGRRR